MLASRHFNIARKKDDDWFDAILNVESKLFIDPFLIFKSPKDLGQPHTTRSSSILATRSC